MNRILSARDTISGPQTAGMILVYNRHPTARVATEEGHMLGGGDRAWILSTDKVLAKAIESGVFRVVKDDTVEVSETGNSEQTPKRRRGRPPKNATPGD